MTNRELAKKEINRIIKSFRYRERKYGISFDYDNFLKRVLWRDPKTFTKHDIRKLREIKGSELYRFGTYQDHTGKIIEGYKTEEVAKAVKKAYREARREERKNRNKDDFYTPDYDTPFFDAPKYENKSKYKSDKSEYVKELFNSANDIINGFIDHESWAHDSDGLREKVSDYAYRVIAEFGKTCFAYVIETANSNGDMIKLKTEAYSHNFEICIAQYLTPHFGGYSELAEIENELMRGEAFDQRDYEESADPYI